MDVALFIAEVRKRESLWSTKFGCPKKTERDMNDKLWLEIANKFDISKDTAKRKWRSLRDAFVRMLRIARSNGEEASSWVHFDNLSFLLDRAELFSIRSTYPKRSAESVTSSPAVTPSIISSSPTEDIFPKIDGVDTLPQDSDKNISEEELQNLNNTTHSSNQNTYADGPPPLVLIAPTVTKPSFTNIQRVYTIQDVERDEVILSDNQVYSYPTKRVALETDFNQSDEQTDKETAADSENLSFFRSLLPLMNKLNTVQQLSIRIRFQEILLDEFRT